MIEIDGSYKHGGGSILRLASGFSVLTQKPIRVINIRAGRPNPGLQQQHLRGLESVSKLCDGKLFNAELNSTEIEFYPSRIVKGYAEIEIPTAGSVGLVIQPILLASVFLKHPIKIKINGGATVGKWAPPTPFLENITFKLLKRMGYEIEINVLKHGFYPKGGADVEVDIKPMGELKPLFLDELGDIKSIKGISLASNFLKEAKVAERQVRSCKYILEKSFDVKIDIKIEYVNSLCPGSSFVIWLETENCIIGSDEIGERGVSADLIGKKVANDLIKTYESGATVDRYTADQIIPFLALTEKSLIKIPEITGHIETSLWLAKKFLGKEFDLIKNKCITVKC